MEGRKISVISRQIAAPGHLPAIKCAAHPVDAIYLVNGPIHSELHCVF
jgi:hypothetical protein